MYYYSASTRGFYSDEIHISMPQDILEISDEYYHYLLVEQENGKCIKPDANGNPIAVDINDVSIGA